MSLKEFLNLDSLIEEVNTFSGIVHSNFWKRQEKCGFLVYYSVQAYFLAHRIHGIEQHVSSLDNLPITSKRLMVSLEYFEYLAEEVTNIRTLATSIQQMFNFDSTKYQLDQSSSPSSTSSCSYGSSSSDGINSRSKMCVQSSKYRTDNPMIEEISFSSDEYPESLCTSPGIFGSPCTSTESVESSPYLSS